MKRTNHEAPVSQRQTKTYKILTKRGAKDILAHLDEMEWKPGVSASYCPSGEEGGHNYEIHSWDNKVVTDISKALSKAIINKQQVIHDTLAFVCLPPKFNKYYGGGEYPSHCDGGFIGGIRTDYACTLFLSDPESYEGGELWVGGVQHKADQGYAVIYECGEPHRVTPVTSGERICAITWMQSCVQDPYKRKLLIKLQRLVRDYKDDKALFTRCQEVYTALQKRWYD